MRERKTWWQEAAGSTLCMLATLDGWTVHADSRAREELHADEGVEPRGATKMPACRVCPGCILPPCWHVGQVPSVSRCIVSPLSESDPKHPPLHSEDSRAGTGCAACGLRLVPRLQQLEHQLAARRSWWRRASPPQPVGGRTLLLLHSAGDRRVAKLHGNWPLQGLAQAQRTAGSAAGWWWRSTCKYSECSNAIELCSVQWRAVS